MRGCTLKTFLTFCTYGKLSYTELSLSHSIYVILAYRSITYRTFLISAEQCAVFVHLVV